MLTEDKSYKTPGVYLEEIFPAPAPELITGVPAFLGLTEVKDTNQAKLLKLWPQFEQFFGQPSSGSYLAHAVRGFFENGGRLCYVVPLQNNQQEALKQGLAAIEPLDTIDLVCAPDIMHCPESDRVEMQKLVLEHCNKMGDRFAILDSLLEKKTISEIQQQTNQLQGDNGALYFPWIKVFDPATKQNAPKGKGLIEVPPCGHIAGIYAQSDRALGFPQTPANYPLEGVLDLSVNLSHDDLDKLNLEDKPGNNLRVLKGRGIRIWGGRTLSRNPDWRYINVRRLFLTVHRWIERNLADVAFEPNNSRLWIRIERELTTYLQSLFQKGALKGNSPQEAFYIKCDGETNPPEMRDAGTVVTEIGLAPTIPNEFIVVRLIHGTTGVNLMPSTQPQ
jgi:hypothetical protein